MRISPHAREAIVRTTTELEAVHRVAQAEGVDLTLDPPGP